MMKVCNTIISAFISREFKDSEIAVRIVYGIAQLTSAWHGLLVYKHRSVSVFPPHLDEHPAAAHKTQHGNLKFYYQAWNHTVWYIDDIPRSVHTQVIWCKFDLYTQEKEASTGKRKGNIR